MAQEENQNLANLKRRVFEVCLAIYRLTNLFPENEILKNQLREISLKIVILLAASEIDDTIKKIGEIKIYLLVAREQNWVRHINFDLLIKEYNELSEEFIKLSKPEKSAEIKKREEKIKIIAPLPKTRKGISREALINGIKERHGLILQYLNQNKKAKVSDFLDILGGINERTVRNDLIHMVEKNVIKKVGNTKTAYYILN